MKPTIVLPEKIYILKDYEQLDVITAAEEFNLYFANFINPFNPLWDVIVECEYGKNHGTFWRINEFPRQKDSFPLKIKVYDEYGEKLCEKETTMVMTRVNPKPKNFRLLAIGDSLTQSQVYLDHIQKKLLNVDFIGSRSFNNKLFHEGRGGWTWGAFFTRSFPRHGVSPFLFPKNVEGKDYYGCMEFFDDMKKFPRADYSLNGYQVEEIKEGQYFTRDHNLYQLADGNETLIEKNPDFEFSFKKYVERHNLGRVDCVSLLMGGNDLQLCTYEEINSRVEEFYSNTAFVIKKIKENDPNTKIIVNTPLVGAEQYCWGNSPMRCQSSSKIYRILAIKSTEKFIKEFEGLENVYIGPMIYNLDPVYGFDYQYYQANRYNNSQMLHQNNWVHPNDSGYKQIGDSLCAVIENIRKDL